ncbi:efflux RND transporter permease subunit [Falsibacillus pallidus]|uniref:HAE1 family hydrophobic/amphiphilic exporter-1 n=1 Tax=Falsibacillus pallidus TaxID=493781 RepID=A0A370GGP1_9BACI|nr:efflux RND transporter permease subunit [Falsibacillus pallidus]RDI42299.1 HAE1 family hydrophobic/amphiphilic exporter-1 [Falsibacillus pallidus]
MNSIINFSLKNKFAIWLITMIIAAAGLYSGFNMKLETIPNITTPIITVTTVYPGATPSEVADKISKPLEQRIKGLNGVKMVSSTSYQNASAIQIEYNFEKNMDDAENEVKEALGDISLPDGVKDPDVSRLSFNAFPIMALSASNDSQSLAKLTKETERDILPVLEGIDGVSSVQISGQQLEEAEIVFKQDKLKALGMDEETVKNFIKGSNVSFPLGLFTFSDTEKSVVVDGKVASLDDLKNIKIPVIPSAGSAGQGGQASAGSAMKGAGGQNGSAQQPQGTVGQKAGMPNAAQGSAAAIKLPTVPLKDIADIKFTGKAESISRTNGKESIGIQIVKASDANTVDVANEVKKQIKELEKTHDGLDIVTTFDQGKPIEKSVSTMLNKAIFGALFAVIIIMLFLRDFKTTIISIISIPLSLLIAVLLLKQMDITLNIMTLGAMTVAIGRVIDDSIVVIENIYRRMSLKDETLKGGVLIREATKEMFKPIASSTIVTIAVFLPLGLVKGMIGELFLPFALTIVFSLLASLLVAVTIVPMMAHALFKKGVKKKPHREDKPSKLTRGYKRALTWSLNHKIITSIIAVLMLAGSLALLPVVGVSFLSSEEDKMVIATFKPDPGQTLEEVEKAAEKAQSYFEKQKYATTIQYSVGGENPMNPGSSNNALFYVSYKDDTPDFEKEKEKVIKDLQKTTDIGTWESQSFGGGGASNKISLYVYGENMKEIEPVVNKGEKAMKGLKDFKNVDSSMSETYDEYTLSVDQEKLSQYGLTPAQVGMALSPQRQRPVLTTVIKDGEEVNVYLGVEKSNYKNIDDLTSKKIQSPLGMQISVKDIAEVKEGKTSNTISRRDGRIFVEVSGEPTTKDVSKASASLQKEVDKIDVPSNMEISMGGVTEDIKESFTQLGLAMLAAIAIVYLILVITFGGGLAPFAILFSLPFTVIGGVLGLLISGETLSISAMIGALMLIGIVVTNAIVLIDRVIHKEQEGLSTREALLEAGMTRLRPILMTAIATIGALLPLALGLEGSGFISKGLGVTVIGGLTSSTLLTLLIVPIVYETIGKFRKKKKRRTREFDL